MTVRSMGGSYVPTMGSDRDGANDINGTYEDATLINPILVGAVNLPGAAINVQGPPYYASGDGVLDDTSAIQAALDVLAVAGGGAVYLPSGTYRVRALTLSSSNVAIFGDSAGSSVLKSTTPAVDVFTASGPLSRMTFSDFTIAGSATTSSTLQYGFFTTSVNTITRSRFTRLMFSGPDASTGLNNGIKFDAGSSNNVIQACLFERLIGVASGVGYAVLFGAAEYCQVLGNRFIGGVGQGRHAVYLSAGASFNLVAQNIVTDFAESAIPILASSGQPTCQYNRIISNLVIGGGTLATTDAGGIAIAGDASHNTVEGNTVAGYHGHGIIVTDAGQGGLNQSSVVRGNRCVENDLTGITVIGAKHAAIVGNYCYNNSQSPNGVYNGIDIHSGGTFGTEVANGTVVQGNVSFGATQRNGLEINPSAPAPTNTVILSNQFGAGTVGTMTRNGVVVTEWGNSLGTSGISTPVYADNAAAVSGGLCVGQLYRTGDALKVVHV